MAKEWNRSREGTYRGERVRNERCRALGYALTSE